MHESYNSFYSVESNIVQIILFRLQLTEGEDYKYHEPTQSPIDPPYKEACRLRKLDKLSKPEDGAGGEGPKGEELKGAVGGERRTDSAAEMDSDIVKNTQGVEQLQL